MDLLVSSVQTLSETVHLVRLVLDNDAGLCALVRRLTLTSVVDRSNLGSDHCVLNQRERWQKEGAHGYHAVAIAYRVRASTIAE